MASWWPRVPRSCRWCAGQRCGLLRRVVRSGQPQDRLTPRVPVRMGSERRRVAGGLATGIGHVRGATRRLLVAMTAGSTVSATLATALWGERSQPVHFRHAVACGGRAARSLVAVPARANRAVLSATTQSTKAGGRRLRPAFVERHPCSASRRGRRSTRPGTTGFASLSRGGPTNGQLGDFATGLPDRIRPATFTS